MSLLLIHVYIANPYYYVIIYMYVRKLSSIDITLHVAGNQGLYEDIVWEEVIDWKPYTCKEALIGEWDRCKRRKISNIVIADDE